MSNEVNEIKHYFLKSQEYMLYSPGYLLRSKMNI